VQKPRALCSIIDAKVTGHRQIISSLCQKRKKLFPQQQFVWLVGIQAIYYDIIAVKIKETFTSAL
jgi:hypothetical protein